MNQCRLSVTTSRTLFRSTAYTAWLASAGAGVLYVVDGDHGGAVEAAEQVFLRWKLEGAARPSGRRPFPFSFAFSARDPMRCSMKGMLRSLLFSYFAKYGADAAGEYRDLVKDQLSLHQTWAETDLFNLFVALAPAILSSADTLLLLQDLEQCDQPSRERFWRVLGAFAFTSEAPFKAVMTCGKSFDIGRELLQGPNIPTTTYAVPARSCWDNAASDAYTEEAVSFLCPGGYGEAEVRPRLKLLADRKTQDLHIVLDLITNLSNWPREPSAEAFRKFSTHLNAVTLDSTPVDILDKTLRDVADPDGLRWALNWLLHAQRPLTYDELAMALCYHKRGVGQTFRPPSLTAVRQSLSQLQTWFCGLVESCSGRVRLHRIVRDSICPQENPDHIWAESAASDGISTFLVRYLTSPEVRERLGTIHGQYESLLQSSGDGITPPMVSDGQDIIFYAIEALPHHVSKSPSALKLLGDDLWAIKDIY